MRSLRYASRGSWLMAMGLTVLANCGGPNNPGPPPPPVQSIELACPANMSISEVKVPMLPVTYTAPVATGGTPPINVSCAPASGTAFPLGTTPVSCNASDGVRTATCGFSVTLVPFIPLLDGTKLLALGDSISAGENGIEGQDIPCGSSGSSGIRPLFIDYCRSYPAVLQGLLADLYKKQNPVVINAGLRGETTEGGRSRLPGLLSTYNPDMLLLLEGVNDLVRRPADVIPNLRDMIAIARSRGVARVFLSTLLPMKPGSRALAIDDVGDMNVLIRSLAAEQGVVLVDNEAAFLASGDFFPLIEDDGLHLTPAGYALVAKTFFDAIRLNAEIIVPGSHGTLRMPTGGR